MSLETAYSVEASPCNSITGDARNTPAVITGSFPEIMDQALKPDVQLALWPRERPPRLDWTEQLEWDAISDIDTVIPRTDLASGIAAGLDAAGYPQTEQGRELAREIACLAEGFATLLNAPALRVRLEVITTDACRKFHMDYVLARLLMPLVGPGTQWIHADRPDIIRSLSPGNVAILRGRLSVDTPRVLHRSPPVSASKETRLLLALDPVDRLGVPCGPSLAQS